MHEIAVMKNRARLELKYGRPRPYKLDAALAALRLTDNGKMWAYSYSSRSAALDYAWMNRELLGHTVSETFTDPASGRAVQVVITR